MKLLKFIFSKYFLSVAVFLFQIAIIIFFIAGLNGYYTWFQIISSVISLIVFYFIINKQETPEYKIPWLFLVFFLPVFGIALYLLFGNLKVTKKEENFFKEIVTEASLCVSQQTNDQKDLLGRWKGIDEYLRNTAHMTGTVNSSVKYYPLGELMWQDLLFELEKAKKFIFIEYFIISPGVMWESIHKILKKKVKEGVEVRILYDDIGSIKVLNGGYYKQLRKEGIKCYKFNKLLPVISGVDNNRDHRKITVIDGIVGFTGGLNIGDEYVNLNDRLGHWKDSAVMVKGKAVDNLILMFLITYDVISKHKSDYKNYFVKEHKEYSGGYVNIFGDGPKPYFQEQIGKNNYINVINEAKSYVYITTPYMIIDNSMLTALRNASLKGVDVRIVTPHIPDKTSVFNMTRSYYKPLMDAGVKIYEYTPGFMHSKMLVADGEMAFVGTINLDYRSLTHHYECGAVLCKTSCIAEIIKDFEGIFEQSELISKDFKLSRSATIKNKLLKVFEPMF